MNGVTEAKTTTKKTKKIQINPAMHIIQNLTQSSFTYQQNKIRCNYDYIQKKYKTLPLHNLFYGIDLSDFLFPDQKITLEPLNITQDTINYLKNKYELQKEIAYIISPPDDNDKDDFQGIWSHDSCRWFLNPPRIYKIINHSREDKYPLQNQFFALPLIDYLHLEDAPDDIENRILSKFTPFKEHFLNLKSKIDNIIQQQYEPNEPNNEYDISKIKGFIYKHILAPCITLPYFRFSSMNPQHLYNIITQYIKIMIEIIQEFTLLHNFIVCPSYDSIVFFKPFYHPLSMHDMNFLHYFNNFYGFFFHKPARVFFFPSTFAPELFALVFPYPYLLRKKEISTLSFLIKFIIFKILLKYNITYDYLISLDAPFNHPPFPDSFAKTPKDFKLKIADEVINFILEVINTYSILDLIDFFS